MSHGLFANEQVGAFGVLLAGGRGGEAVEGGKG